MPNYNEHSSLCRYRHSVLTAEGRTNRRQGSQIMLRILVRLALTASVIALSAFAAVADELQTTRGRYLVTVGGCNDCHTPGYFLGESRHVTLSRRIGCGLRISGRGVFVGSNITPDKETGIGNWTREQIVKAIQGGERPDGRILAPIMPWHAFATFTADDAVSIATFLQSLNRSATKFPVLSNPGKRFRPSCSGFCHQAKRQRLRPSKLDLI